MELEKKRKCLAELKETNEQVVALNGKKARKLNGFKEEKMRELRENRGGKDRNLNVTKGERSKKGNL